MKRLKIALLAALFAVTSGAFAGWSGSGSFTRTHNWTDDAAAAIPITASRMDAEDDNFATGINACLAKNGENAATGNLNIGGYRLTAVGAGSAATDAATIGGTETLINKTLTAPVLSGTVTGTYTLGGTPTINLASITSSGDLPVAQGGTGASTEAAARTSLGLNNVISLIDNQLATFSGVTFTASYQNIANIVIDAADYAVGDIIEIHIDAFGIKPGTTVGFEDLNVYLSGATVDDTPRGAGFATYPNSQVWNIQTTKIVIVTVKTTYITVSLSGKTAYGNASTSVGGSLRVAVKRVIP